MNFLKFFGMITLMLTGFSLSAQAKPHHHHHYNSEGSSRACLQSSAKALLRRIEAQFGQVQIVSTCRPGAVIATSGRPSKHRYGLAIDFRPIHASKSTVVSWLIKNHHNGGTMTYSDMNHIHVDIGQHFVALNSWSGHTSRRYARASHGNRHYASRNHKRTYAYRSHTHKSRQYASMQF